MKNKSKSEEIKNIVVKEKVFVHGVNVFNDIKIRLPNFVLNNFFDVGANVGKVTKYVSKHFPKCKIYSFEPINSTFNVLKENCNLLKNNNIFIYNNAFGSNINDILMCSKIKSSLSKVISNNYILQKDDREIVNVKCNTIDNFCKINNILNINFLKIDTEGYDLQVLIGSELMLTKQQIDIIEVEVGMHTLNDIHISFIDMYNYLKSKNYYVFGIYEQVNEFKLKFPYLRRINMVFISNNISLGNIK